MGRKMETNSFELDFAVDTLPVNFKVPMSDGGRYPDKVTIVVNNDAITGGAAGTIIKLRPQHIDEIDDTLVGGIRIGDGSRSVSNDNVDILTGVAPAAGKQYFHLFPNINVGGVQPMENMRLNLALTSTAYTAGKVRFKVLKSG